MKISISLRDSNNEANILECYFLDCLYAAPTQSGLSGTKAEKIMNYKTLGLTLHESLSAPGKAT